MKKLLAISLLLFMFADGAWAQLCGRGFASITAYDRKLQPIKNFELELLGTFPREVPDDKGFPHGQFLIRIPKHEVKGLLKKAVPPERPEECGNPLKQVSGMTIKDRNFKEQTRVLGFCTSENAWLPTLLRIRAKGYQTMFVAGNFLGGCDNYYQFILPYKSEPKPKVRMLLEERITQLIK